MDKKNKQTKSSRVKKFREFVEKKTQKILSKKIPEPKYLNKKVMEKDTTRLAISEMQKFKKEHDRSPTKKELDKIAESVYKQIKRSAEKKERHAMKSRQSLLEERKKRRGKERGALREKEKTESNAQKRHRHRLERREAEKENEATERIQEPGIEEKPQNSFRKDEMEKMSVSDIFSDEKNSNLNVEEAVGKNEFRSLEKELAGLEKGADSVSKEIQTDKSKCPNCKNFSQDLIFCPECGTAFCSHCAKRVETLKEYSKFTCPKCKKTFKSKKS